MPAPRELGKWREGQSGGSSSQNTVDLEATAKCEAEGSRADAYYKAPPARCGGARL